MFNSTKKAIIGVSIWLLLGCGGGNPQTEESGSADVMTETPTISQEDNIRPQNSNTNHTITPIKIENNSTVSWVKTFGSTQKDIAYFSTSDKMGNSYVTGYFKGTIDFDGSGRFVATSNGAEDIFIVKFDKDGSVIWFKTIGGRETDKGASILIDSFNHIYVAGDFKSADVDFDGTGSNNISSHGEEDIFLLKLDRDGNVLKLDRFGEEGKDAIISMTLDSANNILLTGLFGKTVDFNPNTSVENNLTCAGTFDAFILKLNSAGEYIWAKAFNGTNWVKGLFIVTDLDNNIYITGYFKDTADFDPSSNTYNLTAVGDRDFYIAKLNSIGDFLWAGRIGSSAEDRALSMVIDSSNDLYLSGFFSGECDFDIGVGEEILNTNGLSDAFVLKIKSNGEFAWVKQIGGARKDKATEIKFDTFGDILISGYFQESVDFDSDIGEAIHVSNGRSDAFILKLDKDGAYIWSKTFGGVGNDEAYALSLDAMNHIYMSGIFSDSVDFGDSTIEINSSGESDIFLLKI